MRMTSMHEQRAVQEFAEKAAKSFKANKDLITFSENGPTPGELMALRWGMGEDCVLVVKIDECFEPVNYQGLVKQV